MAFATRIFLRSDVLAYPHEALSGRQVQEKPQQLFFFFSSSLDRSLLLLSSFSFFESDHVRLTSSLPPPHSLHRYPPPF